MAFELDEKSNQTMIKIGGKTIGKVFQKSRDTFCGEITYLELNNAKATTKEEVDFINKHATHDVKRKTATTVIKKTIENIKKKHNTVFDFIRNIITHQDKIKIDDGMILIGNREIGVVEYRDEDTYRAYLTYIDTDVEGFGKTPEEAGHELIEDCIDSFKSTYQNILKSLKLLKTALKPF